MGKYRLLNTTDEWEDIVNENARRRCRAESVVASRERAKRLNKMWVKAFVMATISLTSVILGIAGCMNYLLANTISVVSLVIAGILFGELLEAMKG